MEILFVLIGLAMFELAAAAVGADSRPGIDDEPRRAI